MEWKSEHSEDFSIPQVNIQVSFNSYCYPRNIFCRRGKIIQKSIWEVKETRTAKTILQKKNKIREISSFLRFIAGTGSLLPAGLWSPLGHIRMGHGLGTLPHPEMKSPQSLCWAYHLIGDYLPYFKLKECSSVFTWSLWITWHLSQIHRLSVLHGDETESFHCGTGKANCSVSATGRDLLATGDWCPLLKPILPGLFSM